MRIIFAGLAFWNTIFLLYTVYLGHTHAHMTQTSGAWWHDHFSVALITSILTCLTHSVVYIHFLGTSKGIKEAVDAFSLPNDPETGFERRAKRYKARMRPLAMFAPILIIVTAWLGAAYDTHRLSWGWHASLAYFSLVFNLMAFVMEHRVITENTAMIREINKLIAAKKQ